MGHGAKCRNVIIPAIQNAGGTNATADVGRAGTQNGCGRTLCPAGAKFHNGTTLCGAYNTVGLGGNTGLVVNQHQHAGFQELRLHNRATYFHDWFTGEDRRSLRNSPDITGKFEIL